MPELRAERQLMERWHAEMIRLREMIESLEKTKRNLIWCVKIGAVVAIPTALYAFWAPLLVLAFAVTTYLTGQYFSWGHLVDRRQQLKWARVQYRKARVALGLPEDEEPKAPDASARTLEPAPPALASQR